jgi:hypothetical protein
VASQGLCNTLVSVNASGSATGRPAISADHLPPEHPFERARKTWDAWSMAHTMRLALRKAREQGDHQALADFQRYPEWTHGPTALEALAANRELVDRLTGWRWLAVRQAREHGHAWAEVAAALGVTAEEARGDYLARLERQCRVVERDPSLARLLDYDPRNLALAEPNAADRAHQHERGVGRER